jgi:nicotinate-nucleotide adenylyltransferase
VGVGGSIGILGGAFDPPHVGHLALAKAAVRHFRLDRLLVRVVAEPGHKDVETAPQVRLFLAELAFAPLDEAEVSLDPFSRTVDSLASLALHDPVFLLGADEFADFLTWKEPERVLELARLGVATRPGIDRSDLEAVIAALSRPERVELFAIEPLDVSSSAIRARIAAGEPVEGLLSAAVAHEIERLGLYRAR